MAGAGGRRRPELRHRDSGSALRRARASRSSPPHPGVCRVPRVGRRRPGCGQALLARPATGSGRPASIRTRTAFRGDGVDLLPKAADRRDAAGGRVNVAVYPGSFDPVTYGHLDVVRRAAGVFDRVVIAVLANPRTTPLLSARERVDLNRGALAATPP